MILDADAVGALEHITAGVHTAINTVYRGSWLWPNCTNGKGYGMPECNECSTPMVKGGFTSAGTPRFRCRHCGFSRVGHKATPKIRPSQSVTNLMIAFIRGASTRVGARYAGVERQTAKRWFQIWRRQGVDPRCPCGRPSVHRGWCRYRFKLSPARQAVMAELHQRQRRA